MSPTRHLRRPTAASARLPLLLIILTVLPTCAPTSRKAEGDIAEVVETAIASGQASFDHSRWDALLTAGTASGLVDYDYFLDNRQALGEYLSSLAEADLSILTRSHLMALLINAYNAYTVQSILDHWGVTSIRDIDGVWSETRHRVGGFDLTLDNIEHNLLRPYFRDPRVHVAVNCASRSCAPLPPWAFNGDDLEAQLEGLTQQFFRDPRQVRLEDNVVFVSQLLDWYGDDFTEPDASPRADTLLEFVARYSDDRLKTAIHDREEELEIRYLEYDWSLNQAES